MTHKSIFTPQRSLAYFLAGSLSFGLLVATTPSAFAEDNKPNKGELEILELQPELDSGKKPEAEAKSVSAGEKPLAAKAVVVDVNSKTLTYDQERDVYVATGSVHVVISEQNSELFADQVIYDQNQSLLIAEGHVVINKNGEKTIGTYAKIDLTRQSALINDISTKVDQVRIKAQQAMVANKSQIFENGRLIISEEMMRGMGKKKQKGTAPIVKGQPTEKKTDPGKTKLAKESNKPAPKIKYDAFSEQKLSSIATTDVNASSIDGEKRTVGESVDLEDPNASSNWENDFLHVKAKEINLYRWKDGYTKIDAKKPALYAGKYKIASLPDAQFSQDPFTEEMEYLGPDIGYDPDYGGMYYGPGYDFRLGNGSVRFSPMASFGGGGRKRRGSTNYENTGVGPGIGGIVHYRGNDTSVDLAYNSRVGQPVVYAEKALFDKKTRLIGSMNEDYVNGFMGFERPGFGLMLADGRTLKEWEKWRLDTFSSVGFFKDDFFPNNKVIDLIEDVDKNQDPSTAGRIQFQAQFANNSPLFKVGNWLDFGFKAQVAGAGYSTGDFVGIIRGGPTMTMKYKDRWRTSMRYFLAQTAGDTPFVFDRYYYGRHQVGISNSWNVNDYLSVGMNSQLSLAQDNAKNSLFTGNQFFVLVGPKSVKLNLAYDVIRQRSYFGLMFMPNKKGKPVDFDTLRVFSPDQYQPAP